MNKAEDTLAKREWRGEIDLPVLRSRDYAQRFGTRWHSVYPERRLDFPPPTQYGARQVDLAATLGSVIPEQGVLALEGAHLVGPHGWLVSPDGYLLPDHAVFSERNLSQIKLHRGLKMVKLSGRCLSLASDWSFCNYAHFLIQAISRLHLFSAAGFSLGDIDHVFADAPNDFCVALLNRLGIPPSRLIASPDIAVSFDVVFAPTCPGVGRVTAPWVVEFLRRSFLSETPVPRRRLYIPRLKTRRLLNEDEITPILAAHGFEIYDPESDIRQHQAFAEAEIVVAPHGAALANLAFCKPETRVLELIPTDCPNPIWYALATVAGLRYGYLVGESTALRPKSAFGASPYDFRVDIEEFRDALARTLAA